MFTFTDVVANRVQQMSIVDNILLKIIFFSSLQRIVFARITRVSRAEKKRMKFSFSLQAEKFFSTLEYSIVPIVHGRTNYSSLIPSSGFIDLNEFSTLKSLAEYLRTVRNDKNKYLSYFSWKKDFLWGLSNFFKIGRASCRERV